MATSDSNQIVLMIALMGCIMYGDRMNTDRMASIRNDTIKLVVIVFFMCSSLFIQIYGHYRALFGLAGKQVHERRVRVYESRLMGGEGRSFGKILAEVIGGGNRPTQCDQIIN